MIITKVKSGKSIKIDYEDGRDKKTLTSKEMAATEFYDALSEIALDIKTSLAKELDYEGEALDEFIQRHKLRIDTIAFSWDGEDGVIDEYAVWGDHFIEGTIWDTDIHLVFQFGSEWSPDKSALRILSEAGKYVNGKRAQMNLFEKSEEIKNWKVTKVE